jgi:hypothetical protein
VNYQLNLRENHARCRVSAVIFLSSCLYVCLRQVVCVCVCVCICMCVCVSVSVCVCVCDVLNACVYVFVLLNVSVSRKVRKKLNLTSLYSFSTFLSLSFSNFNSLILPLFPPSFFPSYISPFLAPFYSKQILNY